MRGIPVARGRFRTLRWWANGGLIAVLLATPWIRFDGGEPLVLLDVPARKFHLFGLVIFPQELFFLWLVIASLALTLFFATALLGRMWCGYACPQTVFTDVFAWLERRIQGWRGSRAPRRVALWRRAATHLAWLGVSAIVAFHLVAYFVSPYEWPLRLAQGEIGTAGIFFAVLTVLAFVDFAYFRQTVCKTICPYARFQGVLFDRDTLVIAYDEARGEPRGKRGRAAGDCVDCTRCVQVCPSEIDIREGLQLECIACTHCIDACDDVMGRLGRPLGLIAYRSLASLSGVPGAGLVRPRTLIYGSLLAVVGLTLVTGVARRVPVGFEVFHNRNALSQVSADGRTGNSFEMRVENRTREPNRYRLRLEAAPPGWELVAGSNPIALSPLETLRVSFFVLAPTDASRAPRDIELVLEPENGSHSAVSRETSFIWMGGLHHGS